MPAEDVEYINGPLPRIFETSETTCCVVVMRVDPGHIIDITIHLDEAGPPQNVIAHMLRALADSIDCDHE